MNLIVMPLSPPLVASAVINTILSTPVVIPYAFRPLDVVSINLSGMPEQKQEDQKNENKTKPGYRSLLIAGLFNNTTVAHLQRGVSGVLGRFSTPLVARRVRPPARRGGWSQAPTEDSLQGLAVAPGEPSADNSGFCVPLSFSEAC